MPEMLALSLMEPWAMLVAIDAKRIETRSWATGYRGPLAIHASKAFPSWARALCWQSPFREALGANWNTLPLGAIIAVCEMVACRKITGDNVPPEPERSFGDYTPGRFAWYFANIRALPEPISVRGALGLWKIPPDVLRMLHVWKGAP